MADDDLLDQLLILGRLPEQLGGGVDDERFGGHGGLLENGGRGKCVEIGFERGEMRGELLLDKRG